MKLIKGFYIINFIDSSFTSYYNNNNFYFYKNYINKYDLYIKFTSKTNNFYIIEENELLDNINKDEDLMLLSMNNSNELFMKDFIDKLKDDKII
jgi:hypothetical protein